MQRYLGDLTEPEPQTSELIAGLSRQTDIHLHLMSGDVGDAVGMVKQLRRQRV
jgi:hypothetical protein